MIIRYEKEHLIPEGHPNRPGGKVSAILAFVFHYTANDNVKATDVANAKYFARKYVKKVVDGKMTTFEADGKKKFGYGSTNKIVDKDSITTVIPIGEPTYNAGDRQYAYDNGCKGQTPLARDTFKYLQNYKTVSWEMCNNDNWKQVVENTVQDAIQECINLGIKPWEILLLRHYDLSGKKCPKAFVDDPSAWEDFKARIIEGYKERTGEEDMAQKAVVFKKGVKAPAVKTLIENLYTLGYGPNGETFGDHEEALVAQFQKVNKLDVDGVAGPATQKAITSMMATKTKPVTPFIFTAKTKTLVNFRTSPEIREDNKMHMIPGGDTVKVLKMTGNWAHVNYAGSTGYVAYEYLIPEMDAFPDTYRRFRMFGSDVHVFEITPDMFVDLEDGIAKKVEATSKVKSDTKHAFVGEELARMNAQFFGGGSDGLGTMVDEGIVQQGPNPLFIDAIYYKDGTLDVAKLKAADLPKLKDQAFWISGTSWQLVYDGVEALKNYEGIAHYATDQPRSILVWFGLNHFAFVVVDGRGTKSQIEAGATNKGVTAKESAAIVLSLVSVHNGAKAKRSVNYDGGGSTTLTVKMKDGTMRVVNVVSEGVERLVGTILIAFDRK